MINRQTLLGIIQADTTLDKLSIIRSENNSHWLISYDGKILHTQRRIPHEFKRLESALNYLISCDITDKITIDLSDYSRKPAKPTTKAANKPVKPITKTANKDSK